MSYLCPIEDCDDRGPRGTRNGAVMHMINRDDHPVGNKVDAYDLLDGVDDQDGDDDRPTPSTPDDPGDGRDPALEGPPGRSTGSTSSGDDCPECGDEVDREIEGTFYSLEGSDPGEYVGAEEGDGICRSCGLFIEADGTSHELEVPE